MKYTLLDIVSDILSDMDSDYVDSINDTDEAMQVAQIVKTTYYAMMANRNWSHQQRLLNISSSTDNTLPTHMFIEDEYKELISVFYDCRRLNDSRIDYRQMKYLDPDAFLRFTNRRNNTDGQTLIVNDPSGVKFMVLNNKAPQYFTSFNDKDMVFDSYDVGIDNTLQATKTQARAYIISPFEMIDSFIPDLPDEAFPALIEEAKSKAMFKLKQMQDVKAEQEANRQQRWLSRQNWKTHEADIYPYDYGRRTRGGGYRKDPTFRRE
jgi:hypothetical protein